MGTALITGATAGLGRSFAELLAREGHDLVLVARNTQRLTEVAEELRQQYGVGAEVLAADLATVDGRAAVCRRLQAEPVEVLVNNAGFSTNQSFIDGSLAAEQAMLAVLVTAPMELCHAALPGMLAADQGSIINVSSIAGWATEGTYSAAKAWLTTFTEGLAAELSGSGVAVTAVCPGAIRTEFFERAGMQLRLPGFMWLDPDAVAQQALDDVRRGRLISVTGPQYQVLSTMAQYTPRPLVRFVTALRSDVVG